MHLKLILSMLLLSLFIFLTSCAKQEEPEAIPSAPAKEVTEVPVEVTILKKQMSQQKFTASGVIQPIHKVDIVSEVSGKIEKIKKELGEFVSTKDTLAYIDDEVPFSQFRQAQAQVLSAKNNLQIAKLNLESDKLLFEKGDISQLAIQNSELSYKNAQANSLSARSALTIAQKSYRDTRVTSPFSGQISRSYIDMGQMVIPGQAMYQVVDLSTLIIQLGLPQDVIGLVKKGVRATAVISALDNRAFEGQVQFVSPSADERSGTFAAELQIKNLLNSGIRAGMTAKVTLFLSSVEPVIHVPNEALVQQNGSSGIYKIVNNMAHFTPLIIKRTNGANTIIQEGLSEGDTVVTVGHKQLGVDSKVRIETVHQQ